MAGLKSLAKDTAIYGLSSIVGRFLNYMLVPLYTAVLPASTGGYGVVSNVYAFTALMLVLLTFGMETGFFRFANKSGEDPMKVYANSLLSVGGVSLIFVLLCLLFLQPISNLLDYGDHPEFIAMMAVVVALDSFQCIPFAYLRYKKRPVKFAAIKLLSIIGGIGLNLFFLLVCPWLNVHCPATISWFYDPDYLVGYIFISNLIISVVQMFFFIPELTGFAYKLDRVLLKRMVVYSFPVLILGLGVDVSEIDCSIYECIIDHADPRDAIYTTDIEGLDIIPSHIDLVGAEIEMLNLPNREKVLTGILSPMKSEYDYILIDCSPSLGLITVNALTAADAVIIPVQCEYFALEGISKLLNTIKIIKSKLNPSLEIEGFLLTMYDSRLRLANQIYDEVKKHFQELVFKTVIQRNVKLSEAPSHGLPVILYDTDSTGSKNHLALAKEIIEKDK